MDVGHWVHNSLISSVEYTILNYNAAPHQNRIRINRLCCEMVVVLLRGRNALFIGLESSSQPLHATSRLNLGLREESEDHFELNACRL